VRDTSGVKFIKTSLFSGQVDSDWHCRLQVVKPRFLADDKFSQQLATVRAIFCSMYHMELDLLGIGTVAIFLLNLQLKARFECDSRRIQLAFLTSLTDLLI
jgi:hypothetical protein